MFTLAVITLPAYAINRIHYSVTAESLIADLGSAVYTTRTASSGTLSNAVYVLVCSMSISREKTSSYMLRKIITCSHLICMFSHLLIDFQLSSLHGAKHLAGCKEVKLTCLRKLAFRKTLVLYCPWTH